MNGPIQTQLNFHNIWQRQYTSIPMRMGSSLATQGVRNLSVSKGPERWKAPTASIQTHQTGRTASQTCLATNIVPSTQESEPLNEILALPELKMVSVSTQTPPKKVQKRPAVPVHSGSASATNDTSSTNDLCSAVPSSSSPVAIKHQMVPLLHRQTEPCIQIPNFSEVEVTSTVQKEEPIRRPSQGTTQQYGFSQSATSVPVGQGGAVGEHFEDSQNSSSNGGNDVPKNSTSVPHTLISKDQATDLQDTHAQELPPPPLFIKRHKTTTKKVITFQRKNENTFLSVPNDHQQNVADNFCTGNSSVSKDAEYVTLDNLNDIMPYFVRVPLRPPSPKYRMGSEEDVQEEIKDNSSDPNEYRSIAATDTRSWHREHNDQWWIDYNKRYGQQCVGARVVVERARQRLSGQLREPSDDRPSDDRPTRVQVRGNKYTKAISRRQVPQEEQQRYKTLDECEVIVSDASEDEVF